MTEKKSQSTSRRNFLKASALAATAASFTIPTVHAGGNAVLKIGLIGCGGRGTGAASNALNADRELKLWAMGDVFQDRLDGSLRSLQGEAAIREKIDVAAERKFTGFDAYQRVINSGVDVVLLCTPPHFRPQHIEAAVRARKHIFAEKPVAVDAPGIRRVLEAAAEARRNRLAVVSGFCWRYHDGMRATLQRIHDNQIGNVVAIQSTYNTGALWNRARQAGWSEMEYQIRNWPYFTWLSGDFNVEQHIHSLDKAAWVMNNQYPVRAVGTGGRQVRTGADFGHIFDHFAVVYEYENGVKCYSFCRQQAGCTNDVSDHIMGTNGQALLMPHRITGANAWQFRPGQNRRVDMYQQEHMDLFQSIRSGNPINDGEWMAKSSLMGIMGRMAAYTGQAITWEQAMNSQERLGPTEYRMDIELPVPEVAKPGITRFS